jgi:outer membrane protein assembly factor BamB
VNETLISHGTAKNRYYNGVLFPRTTISCVAAVIFVATSPVAQGPAPNAQHGVTFPLAVKWTAVLPAPPAFSPAFDGQFAYVSLRTNQLVALSLQDGSQSWSVECPTSAPPAAGDGLVFAGSDDLVEARAQRDGRAQWRRPVQERVTALHWDTGWLLASTESGPLLAIRAADGEILWQRDLGAPLQGPPALTGDRVYLPIKDGRVVALSLSTGEEIWSRKLAEPAVGILPVGDRVYVGSKDNQMHSFEADDGDTDWRWRTGADLLGLPVLDDERVYFVALDNVLRGHDRNSGSMEWKRVLPMRPFTGPLLSGNILIVSGVASELHAYSTVGGKPAGDYVVKGAENEEMLLAAPPHLTQDNVVILITKAGQVRALASQPSARGAAAPGAPATPANPAPPDEGVPPPDLPDVPDAAGGAVSPVP